MFSSKRVAASKLKIEMLFMLSRSETCSRWTETCSTPLERSAVSLDESTRWYMRAVCASSRIAYRND